MVEQADPESTMKRQSLFNKHCAWRHTSELSDFVTKSKPALTKPDYNCLGCWPFDKQKRDREGGGNSRWERLGPLRIFGE